MTPNDKPSAGNKLVKPKLTSKTIREQTRAFLAAGGEIQHIRPGVSGQVATPGRKHIILDSKAKNSQ